MSSEMRRDILEVGSGSRSQEQQRPADDLPPPRLSAREPSIEELDADESTEGGSTAR